MKTIVESFNNGKISVWFSIMRLTSYDQNMAMQEKENLFICFFKFSEPSIIIIGELIRNIDGNITVFQNENNAIIGGINYVKHKFNFND